MYKCHTGLATFVHSYVWLNHTVIYTPHNTNSWLSLNNGLWKVMWHTNELTHQHGWQHFSPTSHVDLLNELLAGDCAHENFLFPGPQIPNTQMPFMTHTNMRAAGAYCEMAHFSHSATNKKLGGTVQTASISFHSNIIINIQIVIVRCFIKHTGFLVYRSYKWKS